MTNIAGINIDDYCPICGTCEEWKKKRQLIEQQVRDSAYHIINYKGSTQFAVGLAMVRITAAILRGQNSVLSVSTLLESEFGLNDVCLSVPCVISDRGVSRIIESPLSKSEIASLAHSADVLKMALDSL
jgi:L-lactate dehydrogenase